MINYISVQHNNISFDTVVAQVNDLNSSHPLLPFDEATTCESELRAEIKRLLDSSTVESSAVAPAPTGLFEGTALIMRTSGSTSGTGKLVAISREAITASARATEKFLGGPGRWITCLPWDHIAGFQTIFRSCLAGFEPINAGVGRPEDIAKAVSHLGSERAYLSLVPTQLHRLLDSCFWKEALRFDAILVGGASVSSSLLNEGRKRGLALLTTYGMTETCGGCVYDGLPIGDTLIRFSSENIPRIVVKGSCVALGYIGSPPFNGSFHTNDIGAYDNQKLRILGRSDDAITTGGVTIMPGLIEDILFQFGAGECVVVGLPDEEWGEISVALVSENLHKEEARAHVSSRLGRAWAPRHIVTLSDLCLASIPQTSSGKPSRREVKNLLLKKFSAAS